MLHGKLETEYTDTFGLTELIGDYLTGFLGQHILYGKSFSVEHAWSGIIGTGDVKSPIVKMIGNRIGVAARRSGVGVAIGSLVGSRATSNDPGTHVDMTYLAKAMNGGASNCSHWVLVCIVAFVLLLLMPSQGIAQEAQDTAASKIHIDHSDIFNGETIDGHEYLYLKGRVELSQDSVYLYCDTARIIDRREVAAAGNVIIQKGDSLEVYADTLLYFADTRLADLKGDVALIHGAQQIWTSHMSYDLGLNVARYDAPAQLLDSGTQLASKRGVYWTDTKEALFIDSVVVIDTAFSLISDSLRYNATDQTARFIAPTWIFQEDAQVYCEGGFYNIGEKRAEFRKNPVYTHGNQKAWADLITYDGSARDVHLISNAHYEEDTRAGSADTIVYSEVTGNTRLSGHAEFRNASRHLKAEVIHYNSTTEELETSGRGQITEGNQMLAADTIKFDQKTGKGLMRGGVVIQDTVARIVLESERAEYLKESAFIKAYGVSRPLLKSVVDADTMFVTADTLISFEQLDTVSGDSIRMMTGFHDVRIFRGNMQGLCDSLRFDGRDSVFTLFGDPVMWSDTTQFTADTIDLFIRNSALDKVVLRVNSLIISIVANEFFNQIKGKRIEAEMTDSKIRRLHVEGNAESVYYAQDEQNAFIGVNRVAASEIDFLFEDSKIDKIKFTTKPAGTMTPMEQADHDSMRLEGFSWRASLRPKQLDDLF